MFEDEYFMNLALEEAKLSYSRGDLPVGAVLVIDGNLIGKAGNSANTRRDWMSHAEHSLLDQFSSVIKERRSKSNIVYTTWEPCLMCLGSSILSRVNEIVYACPDTNGGVAHINPKYIGGWYAKRWPLIREGPFREESFGLLEKFMSENSEIWGDFLKRFRRDLSMETS